MKLTLINLLLILKNASDLKKEKVICSYNRSFIRLLKSLYKEGFISYFKIVYDNKSKAKIKKKICIL